jgi:hypothetical protein
MYGENRSARRVTCQARFMGATTSVVRGDIVDVSTTGLCLTVDTPLERGRELHLEFDLPNGLVEAVGEVRWAVQKAGKHELGIRFVRISTESMAVITQATAPRNAGSWSGNFSLRRR